MKRLSKIALMRRPSPRLADGLVTHIEKSEVDLPKALRQWEAYGEALKRTGWSVIDLPPADSCPDSVFIEDALVMFGKVAIVTRPGSVERLPEIDGLETYLRQIGLSAVHHIKDGTLDGGDVLKVGNTVFVGQGGRTSEAGIAQLARLLEPRDYKVVAVPMTKALHLKSACTALPDGTLLFHPAALDDEGLRILSQSSKKPMLPSLEEPGSHVVVLDSQSVLMSTAGAKMATLLRDGHGLSTVLVDISEFERLEGCVTCLSVRVR
jgi:dimethylargininase